MPKVVDLLGGTKLAVTLTVLATLFSALFFLSGDTALPRPLLITLAISGVIVGTLTLYQAWNVGDSEIARSERDISSGLNVDLQELLRRLFFVMPQSAVYVALSIVVLAWSLYSLGNEAQLYNPFLAPFTKWEALAFVANQAAQGALFDYMETHNLDLQAMLGMKPLRIEKGKEWLFAKVLTTFRAGVSVATVGLILNMIRLRRIAAEATARQQAITAREKAIQVELATLRGRESRYSNTEAQLTDLNKSRLANIERANALENELRDLRNQISITDARIIGEHSEVVRARERQEIVELRAKLERMSSTDLVGLQDRLHVEQRENAQLREELMRLEDTLAIYRPARRPFRPSEVGATKASEPPPAEAPGGTETSTGAAERIQALRQQRARNRVIAFQFPGKKN